VQAHGVATCDDYKVRRQVGSAYVWATHNPHKVCPRSCEKNCKDTLDAVTISSRTKLPEVFKSPIAQKEAG
jgi:hypothetical protein